MGQMLNSPLSFLHFDVFINIVFIFKFSVGAGRQWGRAGRPGAAAPRRPSLHTRRLQAARWAGKEVGVSGNLLYE